jgi:hypothetical protein
MDHLRRGLLAVSLVGYIVGCNSENPPGALKKSVEASKPMYEALEAAAKAFPPLSSFKESACPPNMRPLRLSWASMSSVTKNARKNPIEYNSKDQRLVGFSDQNFRFMGIRRYDQALVRPTHKVDDWSSYWHSQQRKLDEARAAFAKATHLRIAYVARRQDGRMVDEDKFVSGYAEAWVLTYDLRQKKYVCAQRVHAGSSRSVKRSRSALVEDLTRQISAAVRRLEDKTAPYLTRKDLLAT